MHSSYTHMGSGICKDTDVNIKAKNEKIHLQDPTHVRKRGWRGLKSHSPHFVMHTQSQRSMVWELKARQEQQSIARIWGSETSPFGGCQAPLANTEQQMTAFLPVSSKNQYSDITNYYYVFLTDSQDICFMLSRPSTCKVSTWMSLDGHGNSHLHPMKCLFRLNCSTDVFSSLYFPEVHQVSPLGSTLTLFVITIWQLDHRSFQWLCNSIEIPNSHFICTVKYNRQQCATAIKHHPNANSTN